MLVFKEFEFLFYLCKQFCRVSPSYFFQICRYFSRLHSALEPACKGRCTTSELNRRFAASQATSAEVVLSRQEFTVKVLVFVLVPS